MSLKGQKRYLNLGKFILVMIIVLFFIQFRLVLGFIWEVLKFLSRKLFLVVEILVKLILLWKEKLSYFWKCRRGRNFRQEIRKLQYQLDRKCYFYVGIQDIGEGIVRFVMGGDDLVLFWRVS